MTSKFNKGQWVKLFPEETRCWTEEFQNKLGVPLKIKKVKSDDGDYFYLVETADKISLDIELYEEELESLTAMEIANYKVKGIIL
jgi:hypothetical protein